jgi:uncharacterized protein (DUF952 family)
MRTTFHLVPAETWAASEDETPYGAAALADAGFIHCTDGVEALGATFDRHYQGDPRAFLALTVDLDALDVPWRYDEPGSPYPHVYGTIARAAIFGVERVERDADGRFAGLSPG